MTTVRVLLFGHYRDAGPALGADSAGRVMLSLPDGATARDAAAALAARDTRLSDLLLRTRTAIGAEFASPETALHDGDEVAFLPPMSGG